MHEVELLTAIVKNAKRVGHESYRQHQSKVKRNKIKREIKDKFCDSQSTKSSPDNKNKLAMIKKGRNDQE